jgi:hypothetical protein
MTTITLRDTKGSPLTHEEMDDNFSNLNTASVPAGGTAGQVLAKDTTTDYDTVWVDAPNSDALRTLIYAKADATITKGQVVMFAGAQGDHILIVPANTSASGFIDQWIVGIVEENLSTGDFTNVVAFGTVTGLNTSAFNEGDILWVSNSTAGALTATKPTAPAHQIQMAAVTRDSATVGTILIRINFGSHLSDIHDVYIATTPTDGQVLTWDNSNSRWNAESVPAGGISNVVEDTSPQLGGALDVNGQSIVSTSAGNITLAPDAGGKVLIGNSANTAIVSSSGPTILRLETNSGGNSGSIQLENGLSGNITLENGAFGKVLVGNAIFANTAIISSSGSQSLTLNTNSGNTASVVLQSGPSANILLETGFAGKVTLGNQFFGNTAILSSSGTQSLTLNTSSGNTASVVIQSGPSANLQLQTGFGGRVTIDNQIGGNVAILSSSGAFPLTLNTNSGNTASVSLQSGPSAEILLETGFGGKVTIGNQFFANTAILSSSGSQSLTLQSNSGNTASVILQSGPTANVTLQTGFGGKVLIGNQFFGNTAIVSSSGSQSLTLNTSAGNTASVVLQSGPTGNVVLETALAGKVVITNQLLGDASVLSSNDTAPLSLQSVASDVNIEPGSMIINNRGLFNTFGLSYIPVTYIQGNPDQIVYLSSMNASNIPVVEIGLDPAGTMTLTAATVKSPNLIQSNKVFSYGDSGTLTWAPDIATNGNIQTIRLTGNLTLNAFTSPVSGQWVRLIITQDGTGSRTLTSSMKFEGGSKTLSTAANAIDIIDVWYIGTTYYASLTKGYA